MFLIILIALLLYSIIPIPGFADQPTNSNYEDNTITLDFNGEDKNLTNKLKLLFKSSSLFCNTAKWKVQETLNDDISLATSSARAYGYYHLKIQPNINRLQDCWHVQLTIAEGPRVVVNDIDIQVFGEAKEDPKFMQAILDSNVKPDSFLLHSEYEQLKKKIESTASKRGYFDGRFITRSLEVNREKNIANIILHYDSGMRYRIGEIKIDQSSLNNNLFRKYVNLHSGDFFNDALLISTYQGLSASGYFSSVDVTPMLEQREHGHIPIQIKAVRVKPKSYTVGVGASTDIGPRIKLTYSDKLKNTNGHSHRAELSVSPVISNIGYSYRIPDDKPRTDFFEFSALAIHEDTDTSTSDTLNFGASNTYLLNHNWTRTLSLDYSIDDFDVGEDSDTTKLLRPAMGFSKTETNSILRPTRGYRLNFEIIGAHSSLLSDISFYQAQAGGKYIRGLGDKLRILSRVDLGYTETNNFDELPSNLRFFAGGDTSIRGYDYESLGPEDNEGDVIGGESLIISSVEIDYMFTSKWGAALFVDAGNAFNDDQIDLNVGAGMGLRWHSPIGPIRVDLGFPVDDPDADDSWRVHFSLGPDL